MDADNLTRFIAFAAEPETLRHSRLTITGDSARYLAAWLCKVNALTWLSDLKLCLTDSLRKETCFGCRRAE
jgi:hypothetical protein